MALHFIFGRAGTGKTQRCCQEIRNYMDEAPGRTALLIVPDQGTYTAEHMLAEAFPSQGFVDVYATGFTRLAWRVFQELHTDLGDTLSPLGQQLILRRLLTEHQGEFQVLSRAAGQPHFSASMADFFHEMESFGVTEGMLFAAAQEEGDTPLGRKLRDLSLLYQSYRRYLKDHFHYQGSPLDVLIRSIPQSDFIRHARIWIDGWGGMTPQEAAAVSALVRTAPEVTVTLPMDHPEEAAGCALFDRPYRLWEALTRQAGQSSSEELPETLRFRTGVLHSLEKDYFSSPSRPCQEPGEGLFLTEGKDRAAEIDDAVRKMTELVRDQGYRWREILVLLRCPDKYEDLLERAFDRYHVPYFMDRRRPMWNHPLVALLDSLLRFLAAGPRGWARETLFRLLKTDLIPAFSAEEIDRLENYVLRCGIRFYQWDQPWHFHKAYDLDTDRDTLTKKERAEQEEMNALRLRLQELLGGLSRQWKDALTIEDKCTILYQWLRDQHIPEALAAMDEAEYEATRTRPHGQVWKKVLSLLDELVHVAGDDHMKEDEFLSMAEDGLKSMTFSMIPPTLDHVTVTTVDRGYSLEGRAVFLPGAQDGEFPFRTEEKGLLTEQERSHLKDSRRLVLGPDLMTRVCQEEFYVYLALTRASELLCLSWSRSDDDGKELSPSFLVSRLQALGYAGQPLTGDAPSAGETDIARYLVHPVQALSLLPPLLRQPGLSSSWQALCVWAQSEPERKALYDQVCRSFSYQNEPEPLAPALAKMLFTPYGVFRSSISRLETYRACPYSHFLKYGLKIQERDEGQVNAADFGSYLHAGLHLFGDRWLSMRKKWSDATDEDIQTLSEDIASRIAPRVKYGALKADEAAEYTENALNRTLRSTLSRLRDWSQQSEFSPRRAEDLEKQFNNFRLSNEEGLVALLQGKIDRIDRKGDAVAVMDYKTGQPVLRLNDILIGCHLQLITYLMKALEDSPGDDPIPAAFLYIYLSGKARSLTAPPPGGIPAADHTAELQGYFLNDPDILAALDQKTGTGEAMLPVKYKLDGQPYSSSPVLTKEQMQALLDKARQVLLALCRSAADGEIPITPLKDANPCRYCPYRSICRFDQKLGSRYDTPPKRSDTEVKEKFLTPEEDQKGDEPR